MNSRKREIRDFLDKLSFQPLPLNYNKGPVIFDWRARRIVSKKDKKRKGRKRGQIIHPGTKWAYIIDEALEPQEYWDDWSDHRDGFRDWWKDNTRYKPEFMGDWKSDFVDVNRRIEKHLAIRKARHNRNI